MYWLYLSHLGDFFTEDHKLADEELYCKDCGDYDELIGEFETQAGLIQELVMYDAYDATIDYVVDDWKRKFMIEDTINLNDLITYEDVLDILSRTVKDLDSSKARKYDLHYTDGWLDACDTLYKYIKGEMED